MTPNRTGLLFEDTFDNESNTRSLYANYALEGNQDEHIVTIGGQTAVEVDLNHYTDATSYRTELRPDALAEPYFDNGMNAKLGQTYYYGLSTYLPTNWVSDTSPEIITQWHDQPDAGEAWKSPAVDLEILHEADGDHYVVDVRGDARAITPAEGGEDRYQIAKTFDLGLINGTLGKWTDWVWKITFNDTSSGHLTLWQNNHLVLDLSQANAFNDALGPYFKFGDYKWPWQTADHTGADSRTLYFDNIRIAAGPDASYNSVAPTQVGTAGTAHAVSALAAPAISMTTSTVMTVGSDTLALRISENALSSNAQYTVTVDGKQVGGTFTAHSLHNFGVDNVILHGDWAAGAHAVQVAYTNPANGSTLYIDSINYDGKTSVPTSPAMTGASTTSNFTVTDNSQVDPAGTTDMAGQGSDLLAIHLSKNLAGANGHYTVSVDGQQIDLAAFTAHAVTGKGSDSVDLHGDWGVGDHTVTVHLLDDGGVAGQQLQLTGDNYDGKTGNFTTSIAAGGSYSFIVHDTSAVVASTASVLTTASEVATPLVAAAAAVPAGDPESGADPLKTIVTLENSYTLLADEKTLTMMGSNYTQAGYGNALDNVVNGNDGASYLYGGDGNDTMFGNAGADQLYGQNGNDVLNGGDGNDTLIGGLGSDTLTGGAGADSFYFYAANETPTGTGHDVVTDFNHTEGDKINLSQIDANTALSGYQLFAFIGTAAFDGKAGELHYTHTSTGGIMVEGDMNGDKTADFQIELQHVTSISATDIVL